MRSRSRAAAIGATALLLTASLAACGGESSSDVEAAGTYPLKVVKAEFPPKQLLGQTSLLRIGVRNSGRRTVPALTVSISIAGRAGRTSSLPFGFHDPEPGIAQPDRPVWVLAAHYPRLAGSPISAGAQLTAHKTFDFGPLKPGATTEAVWKLSAVKTGRFTILFEVGAGISGKSKAVTAGGVQPGGSLTARISSAAPNMVVTDSGKVVTIPGRAPQRGGSR